MAHSLQVPTTIKFFATLIKTCCVGSSIVDGHLSYTLNLPGIHGPVTLTEKNADQHVEYTFDPDSKEVIDRCHQLNVEALNYGHLAEWAHDSFECSILGVGDNSCVVEVIISDLHLRIYYVVHANRNGIPMAIFEGGNTQFIPVDTVPNSSAYLRKLFRSAKYFKCYDFVHEKRLSSGSLNCIINAMSETDKSILTELIGETSMRNPSAMPTIPEQVSPFTFSSADIISFALYLGVSQCKDVPFAMISAIQIYKEDIELFRPCFTLAKHYYTAIGNEKLRSRIMVDEVAFASTVLNNPTCKTSCNVMMCMSIRRNGLGLYFDATEFQGLGDSSLGL